MNTLLQVEIPSVEMIGLGHSYPTNRIDNAFLESLDIGTSDAWILERVGIRSRRTVLSLDYIRETRNQNPLDAALHSTYSNSQTAALAAEMALKRAGVKREEIGLVLASGCSAEYSIPAEACRIAAELKIQAPAFDLNSGCSGFIACLHFLNSMRPAALPPYVLIVIAENTTRTIDYRDRSNAVLWGDGSIAAVISTRPADSRGKPRFSPTYTCFDSDPTNWEKVQTRSGRHFTQTGNHVQSFAIRKTLSTLGRLAEVASSPDRFIFIGHQANLLMLQAVCARAGIPESRHWYNVDEYGNTGAAGAPGVLSQNFEKLRPGDEIAMAVVGAGLSWGGALLKFRND